MLGTQEQHANVLTTLHISTVYGSCMLITVYGSHVSIPHIFYAGFFMWLPYNSHVVHSNSHTAAIHSTNMQGSRGIPMWLPCSSPVASVTGCMSAYTSARSWRCSPCISGLMRLVQNPKWSSQLLVYSACLDHVLIMHSSFPAIQSESPRHMHTPG